MRIFPQLFFFAIIFVWFVIFAAPVFGQNDCLTEAEAEKVINQINTPHKVAENKELGRELLKMEEAREKLDQKIIDNLEANRNLVPTANDLGEKNLLRLCEIVKQYGWVERALVGEEAAQAAMYLIKNNKATRLQRQIFPVIVAAAKKSLVSNREVAGLVDTIRIASGMPQIFGTQAVIRDELLYLNPIQNEARVDEWRKLYDLPPLSVFIRNLQSQYQIPVLKSSPVSSNAPQIKEKQQLPTSAATTTKNGTSANTLLNLNEEEVVKVESNVVNLNVRVYANETAGENLKLQRADFTVFENGKQQEITFFSDAEAPFDLVLLLDLSGSTAGKKDLIRKSTRRFIEAARPSDRIAIVTFTDRARIVSNLTQNREELLASIKDMDDMGGSGVWGSLQFVYEKIIKTQSSGRRSAIVMMTDGVDSSLLRTSLLPLDYPNFSDVLETVRSYDTTVVPIYLDTENDSGEWVKRAYRSARRTLAMIAEETGNQVYTAKKVDDLNGIYERVINDLGKVYSLGYQSDDDVRNGTWRSLSVKIPNHPNLKVQTKRGYYAK